MPHIHLETTSDVAENQDVQDILGRLVARLATFDTFQSPSIKCYHSLRSTWEMGEGAPEGFVHCTVSIMAGRPEELRIAIADAMYDELTSSFSLSLGQTSDHSGSISLTLEIREMDKSTYRK